MRRIVMFTAVMLLASACSGGKGSGAGGGGEKPADQQDAVPGALYQDDFLDPSTGWLGGESSARFAEGATASFADGALVLRNEAPPQGTTIVASGGVFTDDGRELVDLADSSVEVDATVRTADGGGETAFALMCHVSPDFSSWFELDVARRDDGTGKVQAYVATTTTVEGAAAGPPELTSLGEADLSSPIELGSTLRLKADCIGTRLTLSIDGQEVLSAETGGTQAPAPGKIGMLVAAIPNGSGRMVSEVAFDDLVVSEPA